VVKFTGVDLQIVKFFYLYIAFTVGQRRWNLFPSKFNHETVGCNFMTMKHLAFISIFSLLFSCTIREKNKHEDKTIASETNIVYDTIRIERALDSLLKSVCLTEKFSHSIEFTETYYEGSATKYFYFDPLFQLSQYRIESGAEGTYRRTICGFENSELVYDIDTSGESDSEFCRRIHSGLKKVYGITDSYEKERNEVTGNFKIVRKNKTLLQERDLVKIEKETFADLKETFSLINEFKDSARIEDGSVVIKAIKMSGAGYNIGYRFLLDSLLFKEIRENRIKEKTTPNTR